MKTSIKLLIVIALFVSFSSFKNRGEKISKTTLAEQVDYNQLKAIFFNRADNLTLTDSKVIIINSRGDCIREARTEQGNILSSSLLYPLIQRSDLIMTIDGTSYYLLNSE